jgi:hypothetical protein
MALEDSSLMTLMHVVMKVLDVICSRLRPVHRDDLSTIAAGGVWLVAWTQEWRATIAMVARLESDSIAKCNP